MKLIFSTSWWFLVIFFLGGVLAACAAPQVTQSEMSVSVSADGVREEFQVPAGTTVQEALDLVSLKLNTLDRVEPPGFHGPYRGDRYACYSGRGGILR